MIDERTPGLNLPLPHEDNRLDEDLPRLRTAIGGIDGALAPVVRPMSASLTYNEAGLVNTVTEVLSSGATRTSEFEYDTDGRVTASTVTIGESVDRGVFQYSGEQLTGWAHA